jgi:hypothetical protein
LDIPSLSFFILIMGTASSAPGTSPALPEGVSKRPAEASNPNRLPKLSSSAIHSINGAVSRRNRIALRTNQVQKIRTQLLG